LLSAPRRLEGVPPGGALGGRPRAGGAEDGELRAGRARQGPARRVTAAARRAGPGAPDELRPRASRLPSVAAAPGPKPGSAAQAVALADAGVFAEAVDLLVIELDR